jgi:hypothetical protein
MQGTLYVPVPVGPWADGGVSGESTKAGSRCRSGQSVGLESSQAVSGLRGWAKKGSGVTYARAYRRERPACTRKSMHTRGLGVDRAWDVVGLVRTGKKLEVGKSTTSTFSGSENFDEQIVAEKYARKWSKIAN